MNKIVAFFTISLAASALAMDVPAGQRHPLFQSVERNDFKAVTNFLASAKPGDTDFLADNALALLNQALNAGHTEVLKAFFASPLINQRQLFLGGPRQWFVPSHSLNFIRSVLAGKPTLAQIRALLDAGIDEAAIDEGMKLCAEKFHLGENFDALLARSSTDAKRRVLYRLLDGDLISEKRTRETVALIKKLANSGLDVKEGWTKAGSETPLSVAIKSAKSVSLVQHLLMMGADRVTPEDLDQINKRIKSPQKILNRKSITLLVKRFSKLKPVLFEAVQAGDCKKVGIILSLCPELAGVGVVDGNGDTILHVATNREDSEMIKRILAHTPALVKSLNRRGKTPVEQIFCQDNLKTQALQLYVMLARTQTQAPDPGKSKKRKGSSLDDVDLPELKKIGKNFKKLGLTPAQWRFLEAAKDQHDLAPFLATDVAVNVQDEYGNTALHYVAFNNDEANYKKLVAAGANFMVRNNQGFSPLDYAHAGGTIEADLSAHRFQISVYEQNSRNFLISLAQGNHPLAAEIFEQAQGVLDFSIQDINGNTPLHYAVYFGIQGLVEFIMQQPHNYQQIKNNNGYTPLDFIQSLQNGHLLPYYNSQRVAD